MKQAKIRAFQDAESAGNVAGDVCLGITGTLMTDVAICDALISADFGNEASVSCALNLIRSIVSGSPEPGSQDEYTKSLTDNEASMELYYSKVVEAVQARMRS